MKALSWVRSKPKTLASAATVTAGIVALTAFALNYKGEPTAEVDLNDGGVWVTKSDSLLVGHFNNESTLLDGGLRTSSENYDVLQDEANVLVVNRDDGTLTAVDPARVSLGDSATIPGDAVVALGDSTTAILDRSSGGLWVLPFAGISGFEIAGSEPLVELGGNADVTVGDDGTVYAVSAEESAVYTIEATAQGEPLEPSRESIDGLTAKSTPTITAVGDRPVVLDPAEGVVTSPGGFRAEIPDADTAVLQQSSAASDAVTVATSSHLLRVPFDGGEIEQTSTDAQGGPAAPVSLLGCSYGAWSGSGAVVRDCAGDDFDMVETIPDIAPTAELTFRVNRDVVVLNDVVAGAAWIITDSLQQVDNWNDIVPPDGETEEDSETSEETVETSLPERSEVNTAPVAEDDDFGVRPGGSTFLPVVDNDTDADGDVLVAAVAGNQPSIGDVQPINDGSALQIAVPEDASGSATFRYSIDDGRGGSDTATVAVAVHDWSVNSAPAPKRTTKLAVEAGGAVSYNVLPDWLDPDGDDVYLQDVVAMPGDEVEFTTDGQLTYRATASAPGRYEVQVVVADGMNESATALIQLDVRPAGSTLPKTNADHVVTRVGQQVTVAPLTNDTSSSREQLRLARVDDVENATISPDYSNKTFTFRSDVPGVYYVQYLVTAGATPAPGLVRIDVTDENAEDLPPVAVRDVALLPTGGEVLVGVLNNDTDPAGGILVVQSVSVEPGSGVSVSVLNHETLRIGDQGALDQQVHITYRISNGSKSAEGDVVVIPIPAPDKILPPVANDDTAVVRAGDVVSIPVLDNDTHPNGAPMHVAPDLLEPLIDPEDGEAFVSQDSLRFKAGDEAKTVYATYEVVDDRGQKAAGYVTIQILPIDEEKNAAPRPRDVTVRALGGTTVNIPIPLDGIDADGDSVELLGLDSNPTKGRIVEVAQDYLVYEAFADSTGVDSFTYIVRDHLGKEATATIRVGIAPGEGVNQAPYAVKDAVVVRPGREIAVPVLLNDSDPEGDEIALIDGSIVLPDNAKGMTARVSGDRVLVQAPDEEIETSLQYTIVDARGAEATAVVQVTVDEDVPLQYPIARDDRVKSSDVKDEQVIDVDVLANDEDPDGTTESLTVTSDAGGTVLEDGRISVELAAEQQLIRYTITDQDDQSTSAFIFVPATKDLRPTLRSTEPVEVVSGETIDIPLSEYVLVSGGGSVVVTETEKVSAVHANGDPLVKDERTLSYTSADGYFGDDGLTFEVTDGTGPDDPEGRKSTLTIPITVLPPANQPPVFTRGELDVAPGEDAVAIDLAALTTDPDPDDEHSFTLVGGAQERITARVEGTKLYAEAAQNATKGSAATFTVRVDDGESEPVEGTIDVRVTASTRPLATANPDTFPETDQGETITVPVLENDFNPFPDTPLRVLSAERETGEGNAVVDGDQVLVTPASDFVGTLVVRYRIGDATEDPDREVDGQIVLTVQGVPDAPGVPVVSSVQDRKVVLSWATPANNGAEITGYTVRSLTAPYSKQCDSTTCTLDGLTNNVEYRFEVTATNRVGESEPSKASEVARPDARPDTPAPPTLTFGDRELTVKWKTPTTPGSPVQDYTLEISPAPPSGVAQKTNVTGNSLVWEGLENGTEYQVRVRAHNLAPDPSSWSGYSVGEVPAGPPEAPDAPTTAEMAPVGDRAQMQVSWKAPFKNGDDIAEYELQVRNGSTVVKTITVSASETSQAVVVDTSTTAYTFRVRATNKAGWGEWSAASEPRRGVVKPAAPSKPSITAGDKQITDIGGYQLTAAQRNGATEGEIDYQVSVNNGGWKALDSSTISGLTNGSAYTIRVRAVSTVDGSTYTSDPSPVSNSVTPFGVPPKPKATATNNGLSVTVGWGNNGDNGAAIDQTQISIDGGSWQTVSASGSKSVGNGYSQTHSIKVRVHNKAGWSSEATASETTNEEPKPRARTVAGQVAYDHTGPCSNDVCYYLWLEVENFPAGDYTVQCYSDAGRLGSYDHYFHIPENGTAHDNVIRYGCFTGGNSGGDYNMRLKILGWGTAESTNW